MKRYIFLINFIFILNSCASIDTGNIAQGYVEAFKAIKNIIFEDKNNSITSEVIEKIPYASSLLKIGKGPQGLLILESKNELGQIWVSADGIYLLIKDGRIVQTRGLNNNLTDYVAEYSIRDHLSMSESLSPLTYYSYDSPVLNDLEILTKIRIFKPEKVELFNKKSKVLTLIEEELSNNYLGWKVVNKYWIDSSGFIWKSIQHISPKLPPFNLEVTKKPA